MAHSLRENILYFDYLSIKNFQKTEMLSTGVRDCETSVLG